VKRAREGNIDHARIVHVSDFGVADAKFFPAKAMSMSGHARPCRHLLIQFIQQQRSSYWMTRRASYSVCARLARIDRTHELGERAPDFVRRVFLKKMSTFDYDLALVWPSTAILAGATRDDRPRITENEQLGNRVVRRATAYR
jgi:hypothetical protein